MSYSHITDNVTYNLLWIDPSNSVQVYDEAPWTYNQVTITENCAPNGNGQCDGYSEDGTTFCECACHTVNLPIATIDEIKEWHDEMWAGQPGDFSEIILSDM